MFEKWGHFIARRWRAVILTWLVALAAIFCVTPAWNSVTHDGDLAYLPSNMSSVAGERLLNEAFPTGRSKSEMVIVVAAQERQLTVDDMVIVDRIAARLKNLMGVCLYLRDESKTSNAQDDTDTILATRASSKSAAAVLTATDSAVSAWQEAIEFDPEFADAWNNLAFYYASIGEDDLAAKHRQMATDFDPSIQHPGTRLLPTLERDLPILDVWTYRHDVFGKQLGSKDKQSQLIVTRLSQEFMAVENLAVLKHVKRLLGEFRPILPDGLTLGLTGSASVGSEMLESAAESISNTELYTVTLVVLILLIVYRAPLLVSVPLITIIVSVVMATRLVAGLTQLHQLPGMGWWDFKVFTTTRIFIVVILFGAGTDFCLFLISRFREETSRQPDLDQATANTVAGVSDALIGSALTTIIGLAMMFFAEFGKFRNSGPAIGFCLAVTLLACLTLAPSLLRAMGQFVFWPKTDANVGLRMDRESSVNRFWDMLARTIVARPVPILILCTLALTPLVLVGSSVEVTYNFLSELSPTKPSRIGTSLIRKHFPLGETSPIVLLARTDGKSLVADEGKNAILELTKRLYVEGVESVRSIAAPRGEPPTGRSIRTLALQSHEIIQALYLSHHPDRGGDVARLEIICRHDPFSVEAIEVLNRLETIVQRESSREPSFWNGAEFRFTGTTSAIRDLRIVTQADNLRIQVLVVLGVLAVLLFLLRRPLVCFYLILSVLFSYYATLGATELFFRAAYGSTFEGLDWKVPLFLFVILVAIGQDYNIYLLTRVYEEQQEHGPFRGLRRAIVFTGGIITSCGIIMAGTFVSMTTGSLRGIVELGFALSLGVLVDTFIVRPILVPAFLSVMIRFSSAGQFSDGNQVGSSLNITTRRNQIT